LFGKIFHIPSYFIRHIDLEIFDILARKKIVGPETIVITQFLPRTLRKNKLLGGRNILIMGNPNPEMVYDLTMDIQKKYSVVIRDAYSFKPFIIGRWKRSSQYIDTIICGSSIMQATFGIDMRFKVFSPKRLYVPDFNGLNTSENRRSALDVEQDTFGKIRFCFLAHTVWLKGLHNLLEAWEMLWPVNAELHIAGRINSQYMKWIDQRFPSNHSTTFHGKVPDINEFYAANDVFVCPSLIDAGPGTIFEALRNGLPVISSDRCGLSDLIVDGYNGYVFQSGNAISLKNCLKKCIDNPNQVFEMSHQALTSFQNAADGSHVEYADFLFSHFKRIDQK
jgi:glycosyltransferase involved in cell wall biosynthesis